MKPCPICGSEEERRSKFDDVFINWKVSFGSCTSCGSNFFDPVAPCSDQFSIPMEVSLAAREPIAHAQETVQVLKGLTHKSFSICANGKNSMPLCSKISELCRLPKSTNDGTRAFYSNIGKMPTVHFFIRYFEHCTNIGDPVHIEHVRIGDFVYIEALDFCKLSNSGNLSFLWPRRLTYCDSRNYGMLIRYFKLLAFGSRISESDFGCEPFNWAVFQRSEDRQAGTIPYAQINISAKLHELMLSISSYLSENGVNELGILGAGHKGATLVSLIESIGLSVRLFDDNRSSVMVGDVLHTTSRTSGLRDWPIVFSTIDQSKSVLHLPKHVQTGQFPYPQIFTLV